MRRLILTESLPSFAIITKERPGPAMKQLLFSLLLLSTMQAQNARFDSLKAALPGSVGAERLAILFSLSNGLEEIYPKEAIDYGREGITLAEQLRDSASLATLLSSAAFSASSLGDFAQSLQYGYRSLEVATRLQNKRLIASAHSTIGITFVYAGQYSRALEHHLEALRIREELGQTDRVIRTLNNIGLVYHNIGQYDKAIEYYQRALKARLATADSMQTVRFMHNIGFAEYKRGNLDEAMRYHLIALGLAERSGYLGGMAYSMFNLGLITGEKKEYTKAIAYLRSSLSHYEVLGQKPGITQCLNALGSLYSMTGRTGEAIHLLERAVIMGRQINSPQHLVNAYATLHSIYDKTGPVAKAYEYFRLYSAAKDSLFNSTESERIAGLSIGLESLKREREIETLRQHKIIADLTVDRERSRLRFLWFGIASLGVIVLLLFWYARNARTNARLVQQKNENLEQLNHQLQEKIGEVKTLGGLLPICASCKKIRDDSGYWEQLEGYISSHSEARFSHGICPDCAKKLYPTLFEKLT